jgi:hypothetical protein
MIWQDIGVLVSTAPSESYGRTIRESLAQGVPVWAFTSTGVTQLMDICPTGWLAIINIEDSPASLRY